MVGGPLFFQTLETFSRLFPDSRGVPVPEVPGDFFQTFSGFWARRALETPVNGNGFPNPENVTRLFLNLLPCKAKKPCKVNITLGTSICREREST